MGLYCGRIQRAPELLGEVPSGVPLPNGYWVTDCCNEACFVRDCTPNAASATLRLHFEPISGSFQLQIVAACDIPVNGEITLNYNFCSPLEFPG